MGMRMMKRSILSIAGAGVFLWPCLPAEASAQHLERHFAVKGRPVAGIHNVANGRIEVKSWRNTEVDAAPNRASKKIAFEMEQVVDRIDVKARALDRSAQ